MIVSTEIDGFKYKVQVMDDTPEYMWNKGVIVGPPDLSELNLNNELRRRLNNELFNRGLITERDIRKRAHEIHAALQAAFKTDVNVIMEAYSRGRHNK